jgi:selenocysteine-specific elongation factor
MTKRLHKTLENTKFAQSPVIALAANPNNSSEAMNVNSLIEKLKEVTFIPNRNSDGPFLFAIDHCFNIKGQGLSVLRLNLF